MDLSPICKYSSQRSLFGNCEILFSIKSPSVAKVTDAGDSSSEAALAFSFQGRRASTN
jgi:hypothetical protein